MSGTRSSEPSGRDPQDPSPTWLGGGGSPDEARGQEQDMSRGTSPAVGPDRAAASGVGPIAEVGRRLSADLIDFLVLAILGAAVGFLLEALGAGAIVSPGSQEGGPRLGLAALPPTLLTLTIHLGYWTLMEGSRGQSVGKMAFSIRAVREDASALDYMTALKRHVLFYVPQVLAWVPNFALLVLAATAQIALVLAGVITYMTDVPLRQGFHDKFARTLVVKT